MGVGITVKYKYDEKLFRRYIRNASEGKITELMMVLSLHPLDQVQSLQD